MLADWDTSTFTTAPPEDVPEASADELVRLREANPYELVEYGNLHGTKDTVLDAVRPESGGYTNESGKLYIGKEFTPAQFKAWWDAQTFGSMPYNGVGVHHTAIPDRHTWIGLQHLHNTFSYYNTQLGWPRGKGPHLWLRSARAGKVGGPKVYVGTHPASDGIGISYRNHRYLHIEFIDRFTYYGMSEEDYDLYQFVLKIVCGERGIPLKHTAGAGWDGPANPMDGYLFHRRAKTDIKDCPGAKVIETDFGREMNEANNPYSGGTVPTASSYYVRLKTSLPAGKAIHELPEAEAKREQERLRSKHGVETTLDPKQVAR
jgi:hypothetical protein